MTLYQELYQNTQELKSLYRFEGYLSRPNYDCNVHSHLTETGRYLYYSKSIEHHLYFLNKRLKQFIEQVIFENTGLKLRTKFLLSTINYHEMLDCIEKYEGTYPLVSLELKVCSSFLELIKGNTFINCLKPSNTNFAESVDLRTTGGGGYGFCNDWLNLLNDLTMMYSYQQITKENLIEFFQVYRKMLITQKIQKHPASFLLNKEYSKIYINENIANDFIKYRIIEEMERLYENGLIKKNSPFGKNPQKMRKRTIEQYESIRKKTLQELEVLSQTHL